MFKVVRILCMVVAACILLILVAIIGLVIFVNPNDLKPQISRAVRQYTGHQIHLAGDIEWSIFPRLSLRLNNAILLNHPGFGDKPYMLIQTLDLYMRLLPLFHKQLEISKLHVKGLTLNLIKNANGRANWERISSATASQTSPATLNNALNPFGIIAAGLEIEGGDIVFQDQQKNQRYELVQLYLKNTNLTPNKRFPLWLKFDLRTNTMPVQANIKLSTDVILKPRESELNLSKLNVNALLNNRMYSKRVLPISLQTDTRITLLNQTLYSDKFVLKIDQNTFIGNLQAQNLFKNLSLSGVIASDAINLGPLTVQRLRSAFAFKNKLLSLNSITADLYQGNSQSNLTLNFSQPVVQLSLHSHLQHIHIQPLFQRFIKFSKIQLTGVADFSGEFFTQGNDASHLTNNLHGKGQFNLQSGSLKGIDVAYWIKVAKTILNHQPRPNSNPSDTPFEKFTGRFTLDKGILTLHDLYILSGHLEIHAQGFINLQKRQVDFELHAQPIRGEDGKPEGIAIPIKIIGPLANLRIVPLLDKLSVHLLENKFKGTLQQLNKLDLIKLFH